MNLRYLLVDVDGVGSFGSQPFEQIRKLVGPEGPVRVPFKPQLFLAGWVNDCGHLFPDRYPRNVAGSVLMACLGASQLPYAGPVVITGWDASATWLGDGPEYRPLADVQAEALNALLADIRKVLGMQSGTPSMASPPLWIVDVLAFAEHVRTSPIPGWTIVHGKDAAEALLRRMGGRS